MPKRLAPLRSALPRSPRNGRPFFNGAVEPGIFQDGAEQVGAAQNGASQVGAFQVVLQLAASFARGDAADAGEADIRDGRIAIHGHEEISFH